MLWLLATLAFGQADDLELTWSPADCAGWADAPGIAPYGTRCLRGGLEGASRPVVNWDGSEDPDVLVNQRYRAWFTGVTALTPRLSLSGSIPFSILAAGDHPEAASALGFGDLQAGLHHTLSTDPLMSARIDAELRVPTGKRETWIGEGRVRARLGPVFQTSPVAGQSFVAQAALELRVPTNVGATVLLPEGPRLFGSFAWRSAWTPSWGTFAMLVGRRHLRGEGLRTGPTEVRGGIRLLSEELALDAWVGRAVVHGVGSSELRAGLSITFVAETRPGMESPRQSNARVEDEVRIVEREPETRLDPRLAHVGLRDQPDPPDGPEIEAPEKPPSDDGTLPSLLLDTLYFEVDSTTLLPDSVPVFDALANNLLARPDVGPILLEGHASEEGSNAYNYTLSLRRADAIYRALIDRGVPPARLTLRPLGEVVPNANPNVIDHRRVQVRLVLDPAFADVPVHPFTGEDMSP